MARATSATGRPRSVICFGFDFECFWITLTGHNTSNSCLFKAGEVSGELGAIHGISRFYQVNNSKLSLEVLSPFNIISSHYTLFFNVNKSFSFLNARNVTSAQSKQPYALHR